MKLIKNGKTKDVFQLANGNFLLKFKDSVTGGPGGQVDPGGNEVVGTQAGMGAACLKMTSTIFKEVQKQAILPTHMVSADLVNNAMEVKQAQPFGQGLEFVVRFVATGSFIRRFGLYAQDGQRLKRPLVEVTIKDDQRGDPLINEETLEELGLINKADIQHLVEKARTIAQMIEAMASARGVTVYDLKMEFGRDTGGNLMLIDEISSGSMRAFKEGKRIEGIALAEVFAA